MSDLLSMLPKLEQGKTLYCPVWHTYLRPTGNDEVERTQYLMEGEWAKPRTLTITGLKEVIVRHKQHQEEEHASYVKYKEELKGYDVVLPFGKHKGMRLSEVPDSYLSWLSEQTWENNFPKCAVNYRNLHDFLDEWEGNYDEDLDFDWEVESN